MTYDRKALKFDAQRILDVNRQLFNPLPKLPTQRRLAAPTLAWWRFEEGEPGQLLPNIADNKGAIAAIDNSGHNNHLFAFAAQTAPRVAEVNFKDRVGPFQYENGKCLDDTKPALPGVPVRDLFTDPNLARTHMDVLNTYPFSEWTIEASFSLAEEGGTQVVLSKQGSVDNSPNPPFQLGVFGDDRLVQVQVIDASGRLRVVDSKFQAPTNIWMHVAAVCDGSSIKLYLKEDGERSYRLRGESAADGALVNCEGVWAVGRGFSEGCITFDAHAHIDEVRISVVAREPHDFLFSR
jgi:hypothetical protein